MKPRYHVLAMVFPDGQGVYRSQGMRDFFPIIDRLARTVGGRGALRSLQLGPNRKRLPFGNMGWSERSLAAIGEKHLNNPDVKFVQAEAWFPKPESSEPWTLYIRWERIKDIAEGLVVAMREDLDTDNVWHTFSMSTRRLWPIARSSDFTRMWGGNMGAINDVQSLDLLQEGQGSAAP